ncbi:MAG: NHLP family bacteriocin export ABC transporter peptidase/permease/ATPase subunit [Rhodospirillaceae bacterium]|jgi:NHLM bacteriocin system ABC transporter peptidase/ATP-binding protein|nr:NHLP family bacteriocin export ABC transporter peptidase/permease/ATPase subunit [Rhodospirillaceae bacterium]MBT6311179.1 NHLP family bacteriocin export ABC transporter peptidase/permease/ATPase subunit [Rhodospirillaceae bacterium]MBT7363860.1 NHLP family bacteriocin export ABC transporter peptidase/permease/ATPase subunit [Rhodospirillaceae bacterium]
MSSPTRKSNHRVHTPTLLQMEAVECGAAALGSVLGFYGLYVTLEELRGACGVSRDGAKASKVVQAARYYGMEAKGQRLELDEALAEPTPYIAFWGFNHFVVIDGVGPNHVYINDPASGPRKISTKEFGENFTGVALSMEPGPEFTKGGQRPSTLRALLDRVRNSRSALSYLMAASLLLVFPGLLLPIFLKTFIDDVLIRGFNDWVFPLVIGIVLAGLLDGLLTYFQQRQFLRLQTKLGIATAGEFFWHVLRLPVDFYTQRYIGDIADRVQSCHRLAMLLAGPLPTNAVNMFTAVFFVVIMAVYSVPLTLAAVGLTALNLVVIQFSNRKRRDLNNAMLNQSAQLAGASMAGLQAIESLKAMGTENDFFVRWSGYQVKTVNTNQQIGGVTTWFDAGPNVLAHLTTIAVLGGGALLIINGQLTIGGLVAFQMLLGHFTAPVQSLLGFNSQLQQVRGDLNRLDDVLRHPQDASLGGQEAADANSGAPQRKLTGAIEIRDLTFGYNPDVKLIENFNLSLTPGKRVALVGGSGSGKSTLAKLILGLYQPSSGAILYDGKPLTEIPRTVFTTSVASVDQDIFLFEGTIDENLTLWDETIPRDAVVHAAKDAKIHDEIVARPGGYDGSVSEQGTNFSGGQRQRLEIARALVQKPSVIILDEATAALDPVTEQIVDDNLRRRGCTCIIVAHRLSTIRDCEEIILLDQGKVAERGTHDELMALGGHYFRLVTLQ